MAIIALQDVSRVYPQGKLEVRAVDRLNLSIGAGEFTVLSGPSGSGKTTLLNLIGLLDAPSSGQVLFEGQDIGQLSRTRRAALRRDRIGFIFQAYNLIPVLSAYENAEMVMALQGVSPSERRDRVMRLLADVGLEGMAHRRPDELSGGQQQRVAIARAIASEPALVLADEPTANIDSENAQAILDLMERLNDERNITFVFSTHDPRVMERARRLVKLRDGRLESDSAAG